MDERQLTYANVQHTKERPTIVHDDRTRAQSIIQNLIQRTIGPTMCLNEPLLRGDRFTPGRIAVRGTRKEHSRHTRHPARNYSRCSTFHPRQSRPSTRILRGAGWARGAGQRPDNKGAPEVFQSRVACKKLRAPSRLRGWRGGGRRGRLASGGALASIRKEILAVWEKAQLDRRETDGRTVRTDGQMDGRTDERTDRQTCGKE